MKEKLSEYRARVEAELERIASESHPSDKLDEAIAYILSGEGKRVRGVLALAFGGTPAFAAAVEMVHAYSLTHDDLPCMDDDDYRRGKLSAHKKFGEPLALLAGDALLTLAFETLLADENTPRSAALRLAAAAGRSGMVAGQSLEISGSARADETEIRRLKTGALIAAACGAFDPAGKIAGEYVGEAFQLADDIIDGDGAALLYGADKCRRKLRELTDKAKAALSGAENADREFLAAYFDALAERAF